MEIKVYNWHRDGMIDEDGEVGPVSDYVLHRDIEPLLKDADELAQILQGTEICCCGDYMKGYHDNHSPVSMFSWHLECIRTQARKEAIDKCARIALVMEMDHYHKVGDPRVSVPSTPIADKLLSLLDGGLEI